LMNELTDSFCPHFTCGTTSNMTSAIYSKVEKVEKMAMI